MDGDSPSFHTVRPPLREILTLVTIVVVAMMLYVVIAALIARGIHAKYARLDFYPEVSIVIAARNEEQTISSMLDSLLALDYPADRLEILVVNDQSADATRAVAESYRDQFRCRYEIIDVQPEDESELRAKTRPLAQGIDRARGEFILMPDADNRVPANWVKSIVSYFVDGVGMVCGATLPDVKRTQARWLTVFETLDYAFLLGTCAGFSGIGKTQALIGSNFAVRRKAYDEIGTYRSLSFHNIEDLSLLHALQSTRQWRAVFPADRDVMLLTLPHASIGELIRQRRRWMGGWGHVKAGMRAALTAGTITHSMWPLGFLFAGLWGFACYGLLVVGDSLVAGRMLWKYGRVSLVWLMPLYPVFTFVYAIPLLTLIATRSTVRWKERTF